MSGAPSLLDSPGTSYLHKRNICRGELQTEKEAGEASSRTDINKNNNSDYRNVWEQKTNDLLQRARKAEGGAGACSQNDLTGC